MKNITFKQIEIFFYLAKNRSLLNTAEKMQMSQPCMSKMLQRFEEGIGVKLFYRGSKGAELTEEGKHLLSLLEPLCDNLNTAIENAHMFSETGARSIRIVMPSGYDISDNYAGVQKIVKRYEEAQPNVSLIQMLRDPKELRHAIEYSGADIFISHDFVIGAIPELSYKRISVLEQYLAVPAEHPRMPEEERDLGWLNGETLYLESMPDNGTETESIVVRCKDRGFFPHRIEYADNYLVLYNILKRKKGVCICGHLDGLETCGEIRYFPLAEPVQKRYVVAAWQTGRISADAYALVDAMPGESFVGGA
jgi:DNA-binding transcriptional LysR family regulator